MARLRGIAPVLCVHEIGPAAAFLVEGLGFRMLGEAGDPPTWASVGRDGVEIMLISGDHPDPARDWAAYIWVDDIDALYAEVLGRPAELTGPPVDKPYACREFAARMPDGRLIVFGQDTTDARPGAPKTGA